VVLAGAFSNRTGKIGLPRSSALRYSVLHSWEASHCADNRQMTASQRSLALRSASFHRIPAGIPVSGQMRYWRNVRIPDVRYSSTGSACLSAGSAMVTAVFRSGLTT
jgi:hypothetical protein